MKYKTLGLLFLGVAVISASCDNTNNSETINTESESNSQYSESENITNSDSNIDVDESKYYEMPNWPEEQYDCSMNFTDISVGRSLVTGEEYNLSFSFGYSIPNPGNEQYISSNPDVFTIGVDEEGQVIVKCHHAGRAMFRIIDGAGDIRYCGTIRVADAIEIDDMEDHLVYDCEKWLSYSMGYGTDVYTICFFPGGAYTIEGLDAYGATVPELSGTYEYVSQSNYTGVPEYFYKFTDENAAMLQLEGFYLDVTGEFMHLQGSNMTVSMLYPSYRASDFIVNNIN